MPNISQNAVKIPTVLPHLLIATGSELLLIALLLASMAHMKAIMNASLNESENTVFSKILLSIIFDLWLWPSHFATTQRLVRHLDTPGRVVVVLPGHRVGNKVKYMQSRNRKPVFNPTTKKMQDVES